MADDQLTDISDEYWLNINVLKSVKRLITSVFVIHISYLPTLNCFPLFYQDDARWLSVARINTATSYGGSASAPPSFSSSSASPSSCSTNSCGQRPISKRSCFRWDKRSQWTRSLQRLPSVDTETEGFPGGNALRPRRRPRKWGSGPMRSKRKRLIR
ncbi:unnamed protein product, partial [Dicrocoelium dendriticum]